MISRRKFHQVIRSVLATALLVSVFGAPSLVSASSAAVESVETGAYQVLHIHIVQPGDTLWGIARRYGTTVQAIMAANSMTSTTIYVGQRLTIFLPGPIPGPGQVYIVQRGDTLSGIAYRFGTTVQAIMAANNLTSTTIYVGQRLIIPSYTPIPGRQPAVTISPTSGPSGTLVQVVATGFLPNAPLTVGLGPVNSEFTEVARGNADGNGRYTVQVPVEGSVGMQWVFGVTTEGEHAMSAPFTITN